MNARECYSEAANSFRVNGRGWGLNAVRGEVNSD